MDKIKDLKQQRAQAIKNAQALNDEIEVRDGVYTDEETAKFDKLMGEAEKLQDRIKRAEQLAQETRNLAELELKSGDAERAAAAGKKLSKEDREMIGFRAFIQGDFTNPEMRNLQADNNTEGGYLATPMHFVNQLIKSIDDQVFIRELGTVYVDELADGIGAASLDNDPDDGEWTTELQTGSDDDTMSFGKRELKGNPVAKRIKLSRKLLRLSNAEEIVRQRLAYKFAITMEKAYLTGDGAGKPLGLFTASNNGISTTRDVSTDNTTTDFTLDGLKEARYSVKTGYEKNGKWLFHRDAVKRLAKKKDGEGQYLWQSSQTAGDPDMFDGRPVLISEYVPNTFTTGQYVGLFGDFSYYWILDSMKFELQRLTELYAESNRMGFIGRYEGDGMPVLQEAFARIKLA